MTAFGFVASAALIIVNGFFVAAEFAALGARRAEIDNRAAEGKRSAIAAQALQATLGQTLGAAQLGITMASLLIGMIAEPTIAHEIEPLIKALGAGDALKHTLGFAIALAIVAFFHMVIGEMVPKNMSIAAAERTLLALAIPMRAFVLLVSPINGVLIVISNLALRVLRVEPKDELDGAVTSAELLSMVRQSADEGLIDADDVALLGAAVAFGQRRVDDVLVPLAEVDAVPISASSGEVERELVATKHMRLVVYEDDLADVRGFIHAKDLLHLSEAARSAPLRQRHIRPMVRIPLGTTLPDVLLAMRRSRIHLGLVVDQGTAVGVVNLDRVLAELISADAAADGTV